MKRLASQLNALLRDAPSYYAAARAQDKRYLALCNRGEQLDAAPDGSGYMCRWQWTSELRPPRLLPWLGHLLLKRALQDAPLRCNNAPASGGTPEVSFIIGHRGSARLPLLLATLETIAGQVGAAIECVLVEQDDAQRVRKSLPPWVRYVHTPLPRPDFPYCRSWAFNVGVKHARGSVLVLHDNDMLVPANYAVTVQARVREGWEVVDPKRFIFYLGQRHTERVLQGLASISDEPPESVVQNLLGGGSVGILRSAYEVIGGFDEAFVGWGGEDVEFWERACTRRVWTHAALPLVHLWHGDQPGKRDPSNIGLALYHQRAQRTPEQRIADLRAATP